MKFITHITVILAIIIAAVLPNSMVFCKKDGRVSVEFEQGDSCSCSGLIADLIEKFCCEEIECHEDELVTDNCHDELQISGGDCEDTKLDLPDFLKASDQSFKVPVKIFSKSLFFTGIPDSTLLIKGLEKPVDVGKSHPIPEKLSTSPLLTHRTTVLII